MQKASRSGGAPHIVGRGRYVGWSLRCGGDPDPIQLRDQDIPYTGLVPAKPERAGGRENRVSHGFGFDEVRALCGWEFLH